MNIVDCLQKEDPKPYHNLVDGQDGKIDPHGMAVSFLHLSDESMAVVAPETCATWTFLINVLKVLVFENLQKSKIMMNTAIEINKGISFPYLMENLSTVLNENTRVFRKPKSS